MTEATRQLSAPRAWTRRLWRRTAPLVVFCGVYFGILVYPIVRIWTLFIDAVPGTAVLLVIMVGPLLGRLAYEFFPGTVTRVTSALSLTWLGICFMAFLLVITFEVVHRLLPISEPTWGIVLVITLTGLAVYAFINALRIRTRHIQLTQEEEGAVPFLIAQISDVHVGSRSGRFLARVVKRVNAAAPDLVLITGDLIDFRNIEQGEIDSLASLTAPTYFIIGNHERYVDLEAICDQLRALGVIVLRNTTVDLGGLQLIGIDDAEPKTQVGHVLKNLTPAPDSYRILLYHRPDGAEDAARWGAHLMLCGHTHNGQIVPFNFIVRRIFPRIQGLFDVEGMHLYVSPGTGTWGPILRLGSRSEISLFTLDPLQTTRRSREDHDNAGTG